MRSKLDADRRAWQRQRDANERLGRQRSSGEAHRRNHRKYWDTRRQLERQESQLNARDARLVNSRRGIEADLADVRQKLRHNQERLAALSGPSGSSGGRLIFDESAKKPRGR